MGNGQRCGSCKRLLRAEESTNGTDLCEECQAEFYVDEAASNALYDAWFSSLTPEQQQAVLARDKRIYGGEDDE